MTLKRNRTKCPEELTHGDVTDAFRACATELQPFVDQCSEGAAFIDYDWREKKQDRKCMFQFRHLLRELLSRNSTGCFKKTILLEGMLDWNSTLKGEPLTSGKRPSFARETMYNLQQMLLNVKLTKKSLTVGSKIPQWLLDLCSLLDSTVASAGSDDNNSDDDAPRHQHPPPNDDDHDNVNEATSSSQPLGIQAAKQMFFAKAQPSAKRRCVLRRITSDSSTTTTLYSEPDQAIASGSADAAQPQPVAMGAPSASTKCASPTQFCFDEALRQAQSIDGAMTTQRWTSKDGFAEWVFDDGTTWLSEVPTLLLAASADAQDKPPRKKPAAAAPAARVVDSARKTQLKNAHSSIYHKAIADFAKACKIDGKPYDHCAAKQHARGAATAAKGGRLAQ